MSARMRKALADITQRKGRSLLVMLGIFIGVLGLTAINFTEDTLLGAFTLSTGVTVARPDIVLSVDRLDTTLLPAIAATPNVATVQFQTRYGAAWQRSPGEQPITLVVLSYPDLRHVAFGGFELIDGRYPDEGEIVMESGDQSLRPFTIGDSITVAAGPRIARLRVVGLARTPGQNPATRREALGYMSDAALQHLSVGDQPKATDRSILIKAQRAAEAHETATAVQTLLEARQIVVQAVLYPTAPPDTGTLRAVDGIFTLMRALAILAVALSSLLILNTVTTLLTEQAPIIGTMKTLGGTRGSITRGYLLLVAIYALLATLPAVALGLYLGSLLASYLAVQVPVELGAFTVQPWIVALSLGVGLGAPLLAALPPLWNGTRISVREALAAYGVSTGFGRMDTSRGRAVVPGLSQTALLGLRGIFRKRWRAMLTLITLTLAGSSFLIVQTATTSVDQTVAAVRAHLSADITVNFKDATKYGQIRDRLAALPNLRTIERDATTNVTTRWGTLQVSGYEPTTRIYHYQLTSGRWMAPGETDVVLLSDDAARKTGLQAGDSISVTNTFGPSTQRTLRVIGTVKQSIDVLGWIGAAIMPVDTVYQLRGVAAAVSATTTLQMAIEAQDRSQASIDQLAQAVNTVVNPDGSSHDGMGYFAGDGGTVDTIHEYVTRRQGNWYILYYMLYGVALIVGAVGALGLANALSASVFERRREIGMLRAMGARGWRVAQVFAVEGLALGGIAWCLGALLGLPLAYGFVQMLWQTVMPVGFAVDGVAFAVMLAAVLAVAVVATLAPAWQASRARVAEMLRYE